MITEKIIETDNFFLEGFETTINGLEIQVAAGRLVEDISIQDPETKENSNGQKVMEYPAFAFDVEADLDFDVVYDVYLLDLPSTSGEEIVIDRTILGYDQIAVYEGTDTLKFTLMSFIIKKPSLGILQAADLLDTNIIVKKVAKRIEENSGQ